MIRTMVLRLRNFLIIDLLLMLSLLYWILVSNADQRDVSCLASLHESLEDPIGYLQGWNFNNKTEGYICKFIGIQCWHPDENRVLNIHLGNMELVGQFPLGLQNCTSVTGLDLSGNRLSGPIPADIFRALRYLTTLDLSDNEFSGAIPPEISRIQYLNVIKLDNNHLSGTIPREIGFMERLLYFSVSNNDLTGQIPHFVSANIMTSPDFFANNTGLCGRPLKPCKNVHPKKVPPYLIISGFFTGWTISFLLIVYVFFCGIPCLHVDSINMKLGALCKTKTKNLDFEDY